MWNQMVKNNVLINILQNAVPVPHNITAINHTFY